MGFDDVAGLTQQPGGLTADGVFIDLSAIRVGGPAGNTGPFKGRCIDPYAVPAGAHHHGRIIGDDAIQVFPRGFPLFCPLMVVPAATDNPLRRPV